MWQNPKVISIVGFLALATPSAEAQTLSTYGTAGLVDMPTAESLLDGNVALTASAFGKNRRNTFTFQFLPHIQGSFRYTALQNFSFSGALSDQYYDRSFDLHFQILEENGRRPALALGLRDFGGTGIYSSEYLVATKSFGAKLKVTAGLGWGRLAERGSFQNPLSFISDGFKTRPDVGAGGINTTGQLDFGAWFRGPVAPFGGLSYQATERLSFQLEYSSDEYSRESDAGIIDIKIPVNVGLNYTYRNGSNLRAFVIGGTEVGFQYSYVFDPAVRRRFPGGLETAPLPIMPASQSFLADADINEPLVSQEAEGRLNDLLAQDGMELQGFTANSNRAGVRIENNRWDIEAQAVGRAARAMSQVLPASLDVFVITFQQDGLPISSVTINRSDLEELQWDYDGSWKSLARSRIEDEPVVDLEALSSAAFPKFEYGLGPYTGFSFFDPDSPLRYDIGAELTASYRPKPGLTFSSRFRYPLVGNMDDAIRTSNSVIQRVRSDSLEYAKQSDLEINELTVEYLFRPGKDLFGRVTAGYLEDMYGGISAEMLWYPVDSRLSLGAELNYARQRDFDMLLGFQDYGVVTGHASAYYDIGNGYMTQIDVGRYLAGDWGATFALDREFNNGFKIGAFFTLTDVSFDDFGEGSFDKGIRFSIPLSWLTGKPSRNQISETIRPVLRDGGARLNVRNRLFGVVRDYRAEELGDGWGRFYR